MQKAKASWKFSGSYMGVTVLYQSTSIQCKTVKHPQVARLHHLLLLSTPKVVFKGHRSVLYTYKPCAVACKRLRRAGPTICIGYVLIGVPQRTTTESAMTLTKEGHRAGTPGAAVHVYMHPPAALPGATASPCKHQ